MDEVFSVTQFFEDGTYETVRRFVTLDEAVKAAYHYTHNVATRIGITKRVIITDSGDSIIFEWKDGSIIFPPQDND